MLGLTENLNAQVVRSGSSADSAIVVDSALANIALNSEDSLSSTDTLAIDSLAADSTSIEDLETRLGIRLSADALPSPVKAKAADSAVLNLTTNIFHLYGEAQVNYEDLQLNAGVITYFQADNLVTAVPTFDTAGGVRDRPAFTQGAEKFTYDTLQYNFKSKRAIVRNARSQYGQGYVFSEQVKRNPDQSLYGFNSIYTTCALDTPHFGINARKIKVVPNRVIASGPANINIEQVPTPLFLPFGLFPITQGHKSGFVMPTYTIEQRRGLGLLNGGYYFYLNDYVDLLMQGNIYSKGSWLASGISTYSNRYHYQGAFNFSYAYEKTGEDYEPGASQRKDFIVNWRHQSDPKSRPGVNFNASVDVGTGSFYANNTYDVNQITKNQMQSNITYSKAWQNKPYSLTLSGRHSQNTVTGEVDVTLPEANFYVGQFNPFQGKNATGTRWYEKISASYNFSGANTIRFIDSTFNINRVSGTDFRNGATHTIPVSANFKVLRFFTLQMGANYKEYWLTQQTYRYYNSNEGGLDTLDNRGFFTARDFNTTVGLNTRIYGLKMFKRGKLMGIRHVVNPNVSINYVPDYAASPFYYGYSTILDESGMPQYLSPYESSIVGAPGQGNFGKFRSELGYSLDNNLQIKVRTDDSTGSKNITLIDGFNINGAYNLSADSLNWSPISMNFRTNILDVLSITASASFDPYKRDNINNRRINELVLGTGAGPVRFTRADIALRASLRSLTGENKKETMPANAGEYGRLMQLGRYDDYVDFDVPWNLSVDYALNASNTISPNTQLDSVIFQNSINFRAEFNITPRWRFDVSSGYNFSAKDVSITQINLYRDLHCWEMKLSAIPFGNRKMYFFTLNVKAQALQDLRLIRRRDFRDSVVF